MRAGAVLAILWLVAGDGAVGALTLQQIVDNVASNEQLYTNLDVEIEEHYHKHYFGGRRPPKHFIAYKNDVNVRHYVNQREKVRLDYQNTATDLDDRERANKSVSGYDGAESIYVSGSLANISDTRIVSGRVPSPHLLLYETSAGSSLSAFLVKKQDGPSGVLKYKWEVGGVVKEGGEDCVIVQCTESEQGKLRWRAKFWLAVNKNYIPARLSWFSPAPPTEPGAEGSVLEWKEVAPGIWYPSRVRRTTYVFSDDGKLRSKRHETELVVRSISLNPNYPPEFFKPAIPNGTLVYRLKNGKIVDEYRQGGERFGQDGPVREPGRGSHQRRFSLLLGLNIGAFGLIVLYYFYRRAQQCGSSVNFFKRRRIS